MAKKEILMKFSDYSIFKDKYVKNNEINVEIFRFPKIQLSLKRLNHDLYKKSVLKIDNKLLYDYSFKELNFIFFKLVRFNNKIYLKNNIMKFVEIILKDYEYHHKYNIDTDVEEKHFMLNFTEDEKIAYWLSFKYFIEKHLNYRYITKIYLIYLYYLLGIKKIKIKDLFIINDYNIEIEKYYYEILFETVTYIKFFELEMKLKNFFDKKIITDITNIKKNKIKELKEYFDIFDNIKKNKMIRRKKMEMKNVSINFIKDNMKCSVVIKSKNNIEENIKIEGNFEEYEVNEKKVTYNDEKIAKFFETKMEVFYPNYTYNDITDYRILKFPKIKSTNLNGEGLWADNGIRVIELNLNNLNNIICSDFTIKQKLLLKRVDNEEVNYCFDNIKIENNREDEDANLKVYLHIDSSEIFKFLKNNKSKFLFEFYLEIIEEDVDIDEKNVNESLELMIPFTINFNIPILDNGHVAIDFGTSSTCIGYEDRGIKLLKLENNTDKTNFNLYENPTNIMIRKWKEFNEEWKYREEKTPLVERNINMSDEYGSFMQGYYLKNNLKETSNIENAAILTNLKLLPYNINKLKQEIYFEPLDLVKIGLQKINITTNTNGDVEHSFNPIEFYGYLLGKVLTNKAENDNKLRKNIHITKPVKFDKEVSEIILESLKRGIKLAHPQKIRDDLNICIGEEEPVAFVGSLISSKEIAEKGFDLNKNENLKFAVFDFGGGTVDFSYGVFRNTSVEERKKLDKDLIVEIYTTAGDEKGGAEYILKDLAFEVYKYNSVEMEKNNIPFYTDKEIDKSFPKRLLNQRTNEALYNVNKLIEEIARPIFERGFDEVSESINCILKSENTINFDEEEKNLEEKVYEINIDKNILGIYLEQILNKYVDRFDEYMQKCFGDDKNDIFIFRAGNASKNNIFNEILKDRYNNEKIIFVDNMDDEKLNAKTGVAYGQLKIATLKSEIEIDKSKSKVFEDQIPFEFNIYKDNRIEFEKVISKGICDKEWVEINRFEKSSKIATIYYSNELILNDKQPLKYEFKVSDKFDLTTSKVWVRGLYDDVLEYYISFDKPESNLEGEKIYLTK